MHHLTHALCLILCLLFPLYARPLVFTSFPYTQQKSLFDDFAPMLRYLEESLHTPITFHYEAKYNDIIDLFQQNKIDIAYLGPLPLRILMEKAPDALPLVSFNEKNGKPNFQCVLVKFPEDTIDFTKPQTITIALTKPSSMCGYFMSNVLLNTYAHLPLKVVHYRYINNHDEVALSVIRGEYFLGGMKKSIAQEYRSLGLQILSYSAPLVGPAIVVNRQTVTKEQIEIIKQALLSAPASHYSTWGEFISHGTYEVSPEKYLSIDIKEVKTIPQKGNF